MKVRFYIVSLLLLFVSLTNAQIKNTVTFVADMTVLIDNGFDPADHQLTIEGLNWDNGEVSVVGDRQLTLDPQNPSQYKTQLVLTSAAGMVVGDTARWKFKGSPNEAFYDGGWEAGDPVTGYDGRAFVFAADDTTFELEAVQPRVEIISTGIGIQNKIKFQADLINILGSGLGYFDPTQDILEVRGFWGSTEDNVYDAVLVDGDPEMVPDLFTVGLYTTVLTVELPASAPLGAQTGYKFKASPDARFSNTGWEVGGNNLYTFSDDGDSVDLGVVVPRITPVAKSDDEVQVLFTVNIPEGAANRYNNAIIPRDSIEFVFVKGAPSPLGSWAGDWTIADTVAADSKLALLYDDGTNGDEVASDNIWSAIIIFPPGEPLGGITYKYGAYYPGVEADAGSNPGYLDNSAPSGIDHAATIPVTDTIVVIKDTWATVVSSVRKIDDNVPAQITLKQNYPNPFNPETTIEYSLPEVGFVQLSIYNSIGEEVQLLVSEEQRAGTYRVNFKAMDLASGMYFYRLNLNGSVSVKKMILLK